MSGELLPPYAEPAGPRLADRDVLRAFASGATAGWSDLFHIEGPTLYVARTDAVALRLDHSSVLVRRDLPEDTAHVQPDVRDALRSADLELLDEDTLLGVAVALQVLGLRLSTWDLWGDDIDVAFAVLRVAAVGEPDAPVFGLPD